MDAGSWHSRAFAGEPLPSLDGVARYVQRNGFALNLEIKPSPGREHDTGIAIGMKPAGGIRTAKQALQFLIAVKETLGDAWLTNERYRFGASSLLNDLLRQLEKEKTGAYQAPYYFSESAESY